MTRELAAVAGVAGTALVAVGGAFAWWLWSSSGVLHNLANGLEAGAATVADNVKLSPHFSLKELLVSSTATRLGLANVPTPEHVAELRRLAVDVLEPVRAMLGHTPLRITSGYRSPEVNRALAGAGYDPSSTSDHLLGRAADFEPIGRDARAAYEVIRARIGELPIDQLIYYARHGHIHVGRRDNPRRMAWIEED